MMTKSKDTETTIVQYPLRLNIPQCQFYYDEHPVSPTRVNAANTLISLFANSVHECNKIRKPQQVVEKKVHGNRIELKSQQIVEQNVPEDRGVLRPQQVVDNNVHENPPTILNRIHEHCIRTSKTSSLIQDFECHEELPDDIDSADLKTDASITPIVSPKTCPNIYCSNNSSTSANPNSPSSLKLQECLIENAQGVKESTAQCNDTPITEEDQKQFSSVELSSDIQSRELLMISQTTYNRKEKSLGVLCENFLNLYCSAKVDTISLDTAAKQLEIGRRRIYDIVNILESVFVVSRKSKNLYNWHGLERLPKTIHEMKSRIIAQENELLRQDPLYAVQENMSKLRKKNKSLSELSLCFLQLFLDEEKCIVPLEYAANELMVVEEPPKEAYDTTMKTKIRRLYDIANVLVSVGIIEKVHLQDYRKPMFRWATLTPSKEPQTNSNSSTVQSTCFELTNTLNIKGFTKLDYLKYKPYRSPSPMTVLRTTTTHSKKCSSNGSSSSGGGISNMNASSRKKLSVDKLATPPTTITTSISTTSNGGGGSSIFMNDSSRKQPKIDKLATSSTTTTIATVLVTTSTGSVKNVSGESVMVHHSPSTPNEQSKSGKVSSNAPCMGDIPSPSTSAILIDKHGNSITIKSGSNNNNCSSSVPISNNKKNSSSNVSTGNIYAPPHLQTIAATTLPSISSMTSKPTNASPSTSFVHTYVQNSENIMRAILESMPMPIVRSQFNIVAKNGHFNYSHHYDDSQHHHNNILPVIPKASSLVTTKQNGLDDTEHSIQNEDSNINAKSSESVNDISKDMSKALLEWDRITNNTILKRKNTNNDNSPEKDLNSTANTKSLVNLYSTKNVAGNNHVGRTGMLADTYQQELRKNMPNTINTEFHFNQMNMLVQPPVYRVQARKRRRISSILPNPSQIYYPYPATSIPTSVLVRNGNGGSIDGIPTTSTTTTTTTMTTMVSNYNNAGKKDTNCTTTSPQSVADLNKKNTTNLQPIL